LTRPYVPTREPITKASFPECFSHGGKGTGQETDFPGSLHREFMLSFTPSQGPGGVDQLKQGKSGRV